MMIRNLLIASATIALVPAAAMAQSRTPMPATAAALPTPTVGATVLDSAGTPIGKIASITPQAIVLDVDGNKIAVPPTSVGGTAKGLKMAMTKQALLDANAQQQAAAKAAVQARLTAGAPVADLNGAPIGTIKSTTDDMVTMTTSKGDVTLPASGFTANATGQLIIGMTQAQLNAAMGTSGTATTAGDAAAATTSAATGAVGAAANTATGAVADTAAAATSAMPSVKANASVKSKTTVKTRKPK